MLMSDQTISVKIENIVFTLFRVLLALDLVDREMRQTRRKGNFMRKKPEVEDRFRQILKVAHLFYEKEMTKTDISHEIRASTTQVARLLEEARELGFVRVEFTPPTLHELGEELKGRYDWMRGVTVISYAEDLVFL